VNYFPLFRVAHGGRICSPGERTNAADDEE